MPGTYNQVVADPEQWDMIYFGAANGPDPDVLSTHFESKAANPTVINRVQHRQSGAGPALRRGPADDRSGRSRRGLPADLHDHEREVYWAPMWVTTRFGGVTNTVENFVWTPAPGGGRYYDAAETWSVAAAVTETLRRRPRSTSSRGVTPLPSHTGR